jgi:spermidine synthase
MIRLNIFAGSVYIKPNTINNLNAAIKFIMNNLLASQFPFSINKIKNKESGVLYLAMFVMGACGLAYEYTLSKIASDLLGNSVRQWAIVIGVMMFFMGVGSDTQKYFSNNLVDKFVLFEIILGFLGAFGPIVLLYSYGNFPDHYILIQYLFICAIGLIIGFEIPLITRINETFISELKLNIGAVLKMDYVGALAGSLAWIFILPKFFSITETAFILGILNVLVGGFTLYFFRKYIANKLVIALLFAAVFIAVIWGARSAKSWTSYSEQYLYRDKIVLSRTTPFQHIVVTKTSANDILCYINGHLQFNSFDEYIYHENLVHPAFLIAEKHDKVLILGGGDGLALREVLKYPDVKTVTLCDIDPAMTTIAKENKYFTKLNQNSLANSKLTILKNNALTPAGKVTLETMNQKNPLKNDYEPVTEINVINLDASKFLEQISGLYDIIIIDFPDPNSPDLAKLYSVQFYENVAKKLTPFGILVQQSTSPIHARKAFLCIGKTMQAAGLEVIPYHDNVPSFGEWGWWIGGKQKSYAAAALQNKIKQIETIPVQTRYLTVELIQASLNFGKNQLESNNIQVNTLTDNSVFEYYLQAWNR